MTKEVMLTEEESILIQSVANILLIDSLGDDFLDSDFYKQLEFDYPAIKLVFEKSGVCNNAMLQMFLYSLLIIPKEIIEKDSSAYVSQLKHDFNNLCTTFADEKTFPLTKQKKLWIKSTFTDIYVTRSHIHTYAS